MGLYLGMYLGPYVECVVREQTHEVKVWQCSNASCSQHAMRARYVTGNFCAECGAPWGKTTKTELYHPPPHTVLGESEELTLLGEADDAYYLGSNIGGPRRFHCNADEGVHLDVTEFDQEEEMKWFRERFAADLATLAGAYDTCVLWGLHAWYS